jgi:D-xylose transport system substrate-binding protein
MRRRTSFRLAVAVFIVLAMASCSKQQNASAPEHATASREHGGPIRIGFSMDTLKEERWQRDKEMVEQRAREVGADIDVQVANGDDALQKSQCETMLANGVDVLIVVPHNADVADAIVEAAHKKGVPVISYDRLIHNADVDLYVAHGTENIGRMQAEYALQHAPKGNYVIIGGAPTDYNAVLLHSGQMKVLKAAIDRGDVKIVSQEYAKEWLPEEAARITAAALKKSGNNIQAIVASNDGTAGGAVSAMDAAHVRSKVILTGQDADKAALRRIVLGKQTMTIYKSIRQLAFTAVDAAVRLARKQPVNATDRMRNGTQQVPAILLEPVVVDKSNLDQTVIKDGYQRREDVYGTK